MFLPLSGPSHEEWFSFLSEGRPKKNDARYSRDGNVRSRPVIWFSVFFVNFSQIVLLYKFCRALIAVAVPQNMNIRTERVCFTNRIREKIVDIV